MRDQQDAFKKFWTGKGVGYPKFKSKHIADAAWGEFVRLLKYKAEWNGRVIAEVDRFFPSSKRCSCCGFINQGMTLKVRDWTCPECDTEHDRDVNAAVNLYGYLSVSP